jgi:hypothetical protein
MSPLLTHTITKNDKLCYKKGATREQQECHLTERQNQRDITLKTNYSFYANKNKN